MGATCVLGVHRVKASEPVHLIEVTVGQAVESIDWCSFTQPLEGKDQTYWQVPYNEREVPGRSGNWCFFFHYLDLSRPMSSFAGDLHLPAETPIPAHLRFVRYEEP